MTSLRLAAAAAVAVALLSMTGCSGGSDSSGTNAAADSDGDKKVTPAEALGYAKSKIDATSGLRLTLASDDAIKADAYLSKASGVITADPQAFKGTVSGKFEGFPADGLQVVSVDGKVYVQLLGAFQAISLPACVPDPATLLDDGKGLSSLLTATQDLTAGTPVRGGTDNKEVLTPYTGEVPGTTVKNVIPCAPGKEFAATFTLGDDGRLRTAQLKGEFYAGAGDSTYTITVDDYDVTETITKP